MKINNRVLGIVVLVFIFGGIGITMAFNLWQTESSKVPIKFTTGEFEGVANPEDIRGSYNFGDISNAWEISVPTLAAAFGVDAEDAATFRCSELESLYAELPADTEIGTDSVRIFVAFYTGLPYVAEEASYLPQTAVDLLLTEATLTDSERAYLETRGIEVTIAESAAADATAPADATVSADDPEHVPEVEEGVVKGKTTFQDLLDWGLETSQIEAVIGEKLPPSGTSVRDYATAQDVEFSVFKTEFQAQLDALK